jgi:hypothetical protein
MYVALMIAGEPSGATLAPLLPPDPATAPVPGTLALFMLAPKIAHGVGSPWQSKPKDAPAAPP